MKQETRRIELSGDVAMALREAERDGIPVELQANGATYRVIATTTSRSTPGLWAGYDPQKVRDAISRHAGSWSDADAAAMIASLYRAREEGSRPLDRP